MLASWTGWRKETGRGPRGAPGLHRVDTIAWCHPVSTMTPHVLKTPRVSSTVTAQAMHSSPPQPSSTAQRPRTPQGRCCHRWDRPAFLWSQVTGHRSQVTEMMQAHGQYCATWWAGPLNSASTMTTPQQPWKKASTGTHSGSFRVTGSGSHAVQLLK